MKRRGFLGALVGGAAAIATPIAVKKTLLLPESAVDELGDMDNIAVIPPEDMQLISSPIEGNTAVAGVPSIAIMCRNCNQLIEVAGIGYTFCTHCGHAYHMTIKCDHVNPEDIVNV